MLINTFYSIYLYILNFFFFVLFDKKLVQKKYFIPFKILYLFKNNNYEVFFLKKFFFNNINFLLILSIFISSYNLTTNRIKLTSKTDSNKINFNITQLQVKNKIFNSKFFLLKIFKINSYFKFLQKNNFKLVNMQFLRKFRVFNKSRYSRNRQFYRTGVYWCLYINIIAVIGIYFWFYKITINYNYFWLLLYIFISMFILSRLINFFSFYSTILFIRWNFTLIYSIQMYIYTSSTAIFFKLKYFFVNSIKEGVV